MKTKFVSGARIRNTIETDFGGWGTRVSYPFIPSGELWIERTLKSEVALIKKILHFEQKYKNQPFVYIRQAAARELTDKNDSIKVLTTEERRGMPLIRYIDGRTVRSALDPYFILGGHDLVYEYIPKNEVWIDTRQEKTEQKYTLIHELEERRLMSRGMIYDNAHDYALVSERAARRKDGVANFLRG